MTTINNNSDIEWYSGKNAKTHPKRVKVNDVWEEVFSFEKEIREDLKTRKRTIIYYCHIGDNRIITLSIDG